MQGISDILSGLTNVGKANVLPEARKLGLTRVLVTCEDNNEASRRTIEANGGRFERTTYLESEQALLRRYWIDL